MDLVYSAIAIINKANFFLLYAFKDSSMLYYSIFHILLCLSCIIFSLVSLFLCICERD